MPRRGERDRGKERFWRRRIRQWRRSGMTIRGFCAAHGLAEPSFHFWRRTIADRDQQPGARRRGGGGDPVAPLFVPVSVAPSAGAFEIVLEQGRVVRVLPGFDAATLRQLLAVLTEEPSC